MTFLCVNGMQHTWQPTGRKWAMWTAADTRSISPTNAPMAREEKCSVCGAFRHAIVNAPAMRYTAMEVAE